MKVYVIMGNDYPSRVYADEAKAEAFVDEKTREEKELAAKPVHQRSRGRIYWRSYEFELIE